MEFHHPPSSKWNTTPTVVPTKKTCARERRASHPSPNRSTQSHGRRLLHQRRSTASTSVKGNIGVSGDIRNRSKSMRRTDTWRHRRPGAAAVDITKVRERVATALGEPTITAEGTIDEWMILTRSVMMLLCAGVDLVTTTSRKRFAILSCRWLRSSSSWLGGAFLNYGRPGRLFLLSRALSQFFLSIEPCMLRTFPIDQLLH